MLASRAIRENTIFLVGMVAFRGDFAGIVLPKWCLPRTGSSDQACLACGRDCATYNQIWTEGFE